MNDRGLRSSECCWPSQRRAERRSVVPKKSGGLCSGPDRSTGEYLTVSESGASEGRVKLLRTGPETELPIFYSQVNLQKQQRWLEEQLPELHAEPAGSDMTLQWSAAICFVGHTLAFASTVLPRHWRKDFVINRLERVRHSLHCPRRYKV